MSEAPLEGPRRAFEAGQRKPVPVASFDTLGVAETAAEHLVEVGLEPVVISERELRATPSFGQFPPDSYVVLVSRSEEAAARRAFHDFHVEELPEIFSTPEVAAWADDVQHDRHKKIDYGNSKYYVLIIVVLLGLAMLVAVLADL